MRAEPVSPSLTPDTHYLQHHSRRCWCVVCCCWSQVDVTSKTEGKVDNSHMLVKYDARLRDNVAVNVVQEVTDTVQVGCCTCREHIWGMTWLGGHQGGSGVCWQAHKLGGHI